MTVQCEYLHNEFSVSISLCTTMEINNDAIIYIPTQNNSE